jgi:Protein of unknown function (DUF3761)
VRRTTILALLLLAGCGTAQPPEHTPEPTTPQEHITAVCEDGAVSYARNRQGACSQHGGVAQWYGEGGR